VTSKLGLLMALAAVAASSASGSTARGSSPFPSGWIGTPMVKMPGGIEDIELFRIRIDGTRLHRMTNGPGNVTDPSFAPNGKRVVFARTGRGLFSIGLDGSGLHQLTLYAYDQHPVYSPDGKRIAFIRGDRLWVMQSDGSRQRLLRRAPLVGSRPSWSPDSRKIDILRGETPGDLSLYTLDARTGRVLKIMMLIDGDLAEGAWFTGGLLAPNGRTVVFQAYRPTPPDCQGSECEVFALYRRPLARGIASTRIVCNDCIATAWSADSRVLLVERQNGHLDLRVVRDGRTKVVYVHGEQFRGMPTLQPR
jgi:Tol biopolymer transport system component